MLRTLMCTSSFHAGCATSCSCMCVAIRMRKLRLLLVLSAFAFAGYLLYSSSKPPEAPTMALTGKAAAAQLVKSTISAHKVVVFSKSYCPYCAKAKQALGSLLKPDQIFVLEIEDRPDVDDLQDALADITGGRSVPRVFINGQFIGGGDDTARKASNGELKKLLEDAGVL